MQIHRKTVLAAILSAALTATSAYAANDFLVAAASTEAPTKVSPPPTAGGNSAEPARTGKESPARQGAKESKPSTKAAQPSAGGNSAEPDKTKGGAGSLGSTPGHDGKADPKYPSAGGNSASKDRPARTSETPEKK